MHGGGGRLEITILEQSEGPGVRLRFSDQGPGIADVEAVKELEVEHPTGFFTVAMDVAIEGSAVKVRRSALLRTARRLMRGEVYVPSSVWDGVR